MPHSVRLLHGGREDTLPGESIMRTLGALVPQATPVVAHGTGARVLLVLTARVNAVA